MMTEQRQYRQVFASANLLTDDAARLAAYAAVYRDRGLSSDTSIAVDFALDQSIAALRPGQHVAAASVRRLAIVGPGSISPTRLKATTSIRNRRFSRLR